MRALAAAALEMTLERGLDNVTIDDIAERAGVSPRTFFNYFSSKQEAIVGVSHDWVEAAATALRERPADESPIVSLAGALTKSADGADAASWRVEERYELIRRHPALLPQQLAAFARIEDRLTEVLAERLGRDPVQDPYPRMVVVAAVAVMRSTMTWWHDNARRASLAVALDDAFASLAAGMPQSAPAATARR